MKFYNMDIEILSQFLVFKYFSLNNFYSSKIKVKFKFPFTKYRITSKDYSYLLKTNKFFLPNYFNYFDFQFFWSYLLLKLFD